MAHLNLDKCSVRRPTGIVQCFGGGTNLQVSVLMFSAVIVGHGLGKEYLCAVANRDTREGNLADGLSDAGGELRIAKAPGQARRA
jgi:hypothetical protein